MKVALRLGAWIVGMSLCCALAVAKVHPEKVLKVKIEATELDRKMLILKLNKHGRDARYDYGSAYNMKFELVETDYDYRIVFATGQGMSEFAIRGSGGSINSSGAGADVFDIKGTELFRFERNQRGTDKGATNAVAEEIIKRICQLNKLNSRHD